MLNVIVASGLVSVCSLVANQVYLVLSTRSNHLRPSASHGEMLPFIRLAVPYQRHLSTIKQQTFAVATSVYARNHKTFLFADVHVQSPYFRPLSLSLRKNQKLECELMNIHSIFHVFFLRISMFSVWLSPHDAVGAGRVLASLGHDTSIYANSFFLNEFRLWPTKQSSDR